MSHYFVRLGCLGDIYIAQSSGDYPRGRRVIVRTGRGVELAEIVGSRSTETGSISASADSSAAQVLTIIRGTTDQDELLIGRLDRHKRDAVEFCRIRLAQSGAQATLLDVDQIFDGATLVMHFLGPIDETATQIKEEVAKHYESIVGTTAFAKLLSDGCGPDCGTEAGGGCGGSCSGCAVASACRTAS